MSDEKLNSVALQGCITSEFREEGDLTLFTVDSFPCCARGNHALNLKQNCKKGDEIALSGKLSVIEVESKKKFAVEMEFASYGRKSRAV